MYCSECGFAAQGKFCANCGMALAPPPVSASPRILSAAMPSDPSSWTDTVHYETIVRAPEVRALLARAAEQSGRRISGEEFLRFCDKAFGSYYGGVKLEKLVAVVQPIYAGMGIKTGKEQKRVYTRPPGSVIVALLCSLARRGRPLRQVRQAADGCLFEATLPSDIWSLAGDLLVEVHVDGPATTVEARTVVKGQLFD